MKMNPVVHFEMPAEDKGRMSAFYTSVFGWKTEQLGLEMGNYVLVQTDETDNKGMLRQTNRINGGFYEKEKGKEHQCPHLVIAVPDIKAHMKKVTDGGGTVHGEPMDIPGIGSFVMFTDTEGNTVGMLEPSQEM